MKKRNKICALTIVGMFLLMSASAFYATAQRTEKEAQETSLTTCAGKPDLIVSTSIELVDRNLWSAQFDITWTVTNIGTATCPKLHLGIWGYIDGGLTLTLGTDELEPGESCSRTRTFIFSVGLMQSFKFTTKGIADPVDEVDEENDYNNVDEQTYTVKATSCVKNIFMPRFLEQILMIFRLLGK